MLFVPSDDGRIHSEARHTASEHCVAGATVSATAMRSLADEWSVLGLTDGFKFTCSNPTTMATSRTIDGAGRTDGLGRCSVDDR